MTCPAVIMTSCRKQPATSTRRCRLENQCLRPHEGSKLGRQGKISTCWTRLTFLRKRYRTRSSTKLIVVIVAFSLPSVQKCSLVLCARYIQTYALLPFVGLEQHDQVIESYSCGLGNVHGRLYVTSKYALFSGWRNTKVSKPKADAKPQHRRVRLGLSMSMCNPVRVAIFPTKNS